MRFSLRPISAADEDFLFRLFESTYGSPFLALPLAPAQTTALIRMQFDAQRRTYEQRYPHSRHLLIECTGEAAGRLWLNETETEIVVVDIIVLPERQRSGIATAVLQQTIAEAEQGNKVVHLTVRPENEAATALYQKLGFESVDRNELYIQMERGASKPAP